MTNELNALAKKLRENKWVAEVKDSKIEILIHPLFFLHITMEGKQCFMQVNHRTQGSVTKIVPIGESELLTGLHGYMRYDEVKEFVLSKQKHYSTS